MGFFTGLLIGGLLGAYWTRPGGWLGGWHGYYWPGYWYPGWYGYGHPAYYGYPAYYGPQYWPRGYWYW